MLNEIREKVICSRCLAEGTTTAPVIRVCQCVSDSGLMHVQCMLEVVKDTNVLACIKCGKNYNQESLYKPYVMARERLELDNFVVKMFSLILSIGLSFMLGMGVSYLTRLISYFINGSFTYSLGAMEFKLTPGWGDLVWASCGILLFTLVTKTVGTWCPALKRGFFLLGGERLWSSNDYPEMDPSSDFQMTGDSNNRKKEKDGKVYRDVEEDDGSNTISTGPDSTETESYDKDQVSARLNRETVDVEALKHEEEEQDKINKL